MSKYITIWGLYWINIGRTKGYSEFFDTFEQALSAKYDMPQYGTSYIIEHTYDSED